MIPATIIGAIAINVNSSVVGSAACLAAALALDVGFNDFVIAPALRRKAAEEARLKLRVGGDG